MAHVYIRVSKDKCRLPVAIADTAEELAKITGHNRSTIYRAVSKADGLYEKVEIEDMEEEE